MNDKRVFTIVIDGVEKAYKDSVKLRDVLKEIDNVQANVNVQANKATSASRNKSKALTDEEKAERKLEQTLERRRQLDTQIAREQINANQLYRERAQELQRTLQLENAASGSIVEKRLQIASLTSAYRALSQEERNAENIGGAMLKQIQQLREEYNELERSLGNHTVDVGNYGKATENLSEQLNALGDNVNSLANDTKGILNLFRLSATAVAFFGDESENTKKLLTDLGKILTAVNLLQQVNNSLIKSGTLLQKTRAAIDALVTKGIISQTTAQTALNIATKAFPLLAAVAGLTALITLLVTFGKHTKDAANDTDKLRRSAENLRKENELTASTLAGNLIAYRKLQKQWNDLAGDLDRKKKFVTQNKDEFAQLGIKVNDVNDAENVLERNTPAVVNALKLRAQAAAAQKIAAEIYEEGIRKQLEADRKLLESQQEAAQVVAGSKYVEENGRMVQVWVTQAEYLTQEYENLKTQAADYFTQAEAAFDYGNNKMLESNKKFADANIEIVTDTTDKTKDLTKKTGDDLAKIIENINSERLKQIQDAEEREIAVIRNNADKRLREIKGNGEKETQLRKLIEQNTQDEILKVRDRYDQQRVISELQTEVNLSNARLNVFREGSQEYHEEVKKNIEAVAKLETQRVIFSVMSEEERASRLIQINTKLYSDLQKLESDYQEQTNAENESTSVLEATLQYEKGIINKQQYEEKIQQIELASLIELIRLRKENGEDTTELEIELSQRRIQIAQYEADKIKNYYQSIYDALQKYVNDINMGVTAIFDATNTILDAQLEEANARYEAIAKKYDEVVEKREESDSRLEELNQKAQNAQGGRLKILQEQIAQEMANRDKLANQEKQLARDKERAEEQVARKETQRKKAELAQNIIQGIGNTALAVTKVLPNFVLAALVGAAGAVQVGVMTAQLAKLENGGLLKGKRHSAGGMRVEGTNIEVEGGEYVVNRISTQKNLPLIRYINSQKRELGAGEVSSFFSKTARGFEPPFRRELEEGGQLPSVNLSSNFDNESLLDAIRSIKLESQVSVTDINNKNSEMVKVDDWTGI